MESKNGKNGSSKFRQGSEGSQLEGESRSVGAFSAASSEHGSYQIATLGADSYKSDTFVTGQQSIGEFSGKLVSQLIDETEKQLAYYEQQAEVLRDRLKELKQIPESLTDVNHTE
ncbi:hypothetical protein [Nostoc sp. NZL]|uniref:hypothetical protein n=1 Tax=Nostoc sp. NZL TaxID=2650612 RepID=UPI0018C4CA64|nr:hypothetical protein [Nostoc sp. NZL]MBG1240991.1 hypothetical protein [Nostoc sp. NZL]